MAKSKAKRNITSTRLPERMRRVNQRAVKMDSGKSDKRDARGRSYKGEW